MTAQRGSSSALPPTALKQLDDFNNGTGRMGRIDPATGKPEVDANGKEKWYTAAEMEALHTAQYGPPPEPPDGTPVYGPGIARNIVGIKGSAPAGTVVPIKVWRNGAYHIIKVKITGPGQHPGTVAVDQADAARQLPPFDPRLASRESTPAQDAAAQAALTAAGGGE